MLVLSNTHNSTVYMEGNILIYGIFTVYSVLKHNPPVYMEGNIMVYGIVCFTSNTILVYMEGNILLNETTTSTTVCPTPQHIANSGSRGKSDPL